MSDFPKQILELTQAVHGFVRKDAAPDAGAS